MAELENLAYSESHLGKNEESDEIKVSVDPDAPVM